MAKSDLAGQKSPRWLAEMMQVMRLAYRRVAAPAPYRVSRAEFEALKQRVERIERTPPLDLHGL